MATKTTTQSVTILGPNLADQSKGSIVVHAAGCSDIAKVRGFSGPADAWTTDFASKREIVEDCYPPDQFEWSDGPNDQNYWGDIHFAPCVKLPKEV